MSYELTAPLIPNIDFKTEDTGYNGCYSETVSSSQNYYQNAYVPPSQSNYDQGQYFSLVNPNVTSSASSSLTYQGNGISNSVANGGFNPLGRSSGLLPARNCGQVFNNFPVELEYKNFPEKMYKTQKRIRGKSEQRVEKNDLEFMLDFMDPVTLDLVGSIQIQVKRTKEVVNEAKYIGPIQIEPKSMMLVEGTNKYQIKVDLDSIYEVNGRKVYQLHKTATEELNLFHLIINIKLKDGRFKSIETKDILLIGKKTGTTNVDSNIRTPNSFVHPRNDSFSSVGGDTPSSGYNSTHGEDDDVIYAGNIVAEHIKTKRLQVGDFVVADTIQTHHGDIAYHFPLEDCYEIFKEGEVVGFIHDKCENKMKIVKLADDNSDQVVLKGVITRSQYFEAMKPTNDDVPTETVCMMGVVPVKVQGSVTANEPLYASQQRPGIAVSGCNPKCKHSLKDSSLIGYAFQSFHPQVENEIGVVEAGVSVLNTASHVLLNQRFRMMERNWEGKISRLTKTNRKFKLCLSWSSAILALLVILVGIYMWQLLTPGSAYRYYLCEKGALSGREAVFSYVPGKYEFNQVQVNGIEFDFNTLKKKTDHENYGKYKDPGARYYLNLDLCAFGGRRSTRDITSKQKRVYGPDIFVVDSKCSKVYYYVEWKEEWRKVVYHYMSKPDVFSEKDAKPSCKPDPRV